MIRKTHTFPSQDVAEAFGKDFRKSWGPGYDGSYQVWQGSDGQWVCQTSRYSSCD